jgi:hypothetical protein
MVVVDALQSDIVDGMSLGTKLVVLRFEEQNITLLNPTVRVNFNFLDLHNHFFIFFNR